MSPGRSAEFAAMSLLSTVGALTTVPGNGPGTYVLVVTVAAGRAGRAGRR